MNISPLSQALSLQFRSALPLPLCMLNFFVAESSTVAPVFTAPNDVVTATACRYDIKVPLLYSLQLKLLKLSKLTSLP